MNYISKSFTFVTVYLQLSSLTDHCKHEEDLKRWNPCDGTRGVLGKKNCLVVTLELSNTWYNRES